MPTVPVEALQQLQGPKGAMPCHVLLLTSDRTLF